MKSKQTIKRYRSRYSKLLRLYTKSYYERFGEGMEQTFNDILREKAADNKNIFACALRIFFETFLRIIKNNIEFTVMKNKRILIIFAVTALILMVPFIAMQFTAEVNWSFMDFVIMGALLSGTGLTYEFISRKAKNAAYKIAGGLAILTGFLIIWVSLAVAIIGEDNPANMIYIGMLILGYIGAFTARFEAKVMSLLLFSMAGFQMIIPVIALIFWPEDFSPGVAKVFLLNSFFAMMFIASALLFRRAENNKYKLKSAG